MEKCKKKKQDKKNQKKVRRAISETSQTQAGCDWPELTRGDTALRPDVVKKPNPQRREESESHLP